MVQSDSYNSNKIIDDSSLKAREVSEEIFSGKITGEVTDYFIYPDGKRVLVREPDHNIIVATCSVLLASLIKGEAGFLGATYWAVGSGSELWPDNPPQSPVTTATKLTVETYRKAINPATIIFLDPLNVESLVPTRKIEITLVFDNNEANGPLREFGLFGGLASATADSGLMINHKIHPLLYKTDIVQLERILRLSF